ncbi:MAG: hypothetical protein ABEJ05_05600 [Haloglomus sp.]
MTLPTAVQLGLLAALVVGGFALERVAVRAGPLVRVPTVVRVLLTGSALGGPWVLSDAGLLPTTPLVDEIITTLSVVLVSYVAVTVLVGRPAAGGPGPCGGERHAERGE